MKTPKKSTSWQEIRRILSTKSHKELLQLIGMYMRYARRSRTSSMHGC